MGVCFAKVSEINLTSVLQSIMNLNEVKEQLNIDEEMMTLSEKLLEGEFYDWKKFKKTKLSPISEDTFCMLPHLLHMV